MYKSTINIKLYIFVIISLIFLSSCAVDSDRKDGFIYMRLNTNPNTLDPALINNVASAEIAAKIFNGLVRLNDSLEILPDIASSWKISNDGLRYSFYLKKGVKFSNGREVTAHDFKYSFQRVLAKETRSPNTWVFDKILGEKQFVSGNAKEVCGIKVINDYTLEITLIKPFSPFLSMLTMTTAYVVPKEEIIRHGRDFSVKPIGAGPFILTEWSLNNYIILEANIGYFQLSPKARGIYYRVIPEDLTAITQFELGNIDLISLSGQSYAMFDKRPDMKPLIHKIKGLDTYYLGLNCSKFPFSNPEIRRAIAMAIDRKKILETFYNGRGTIANGVVPEQLRRWLAPLEIKFDPLMAKKIINTLVPDGINVTMYVSSDQEIVDIAEIIQSYLKNVGVKVTLRQLEWNAFVEAVNNGETDMFWLSWWADYPDPENFLFPLFHSSNLGSGGNRTRYSNIIVDRMIEKGQDSIDPTSINTYYKQAEDIIAQDCPWVTFWHKNDYIIQQPWIKGFKVSPIYTIDKGEEVYISSEKIKEKTIHH
jgi:peptide/nickel transport system substrate-binding protein/oligopeptide transport system substrate-binding protein